jgi:hypothetical protein
LADLVVLSAVNIRVERRKTGNGDVVGQQVELGDVPPSLSFGLELYIV